MAVKLGNNGKGRRGRGKHGVSAEINVTPLVDVMLVLLVIFMVTAPMLTAGVPIDLPDSEANAIHEDDQGPIEISLTGKGEVYIGETAVSDEKLISTLTAMTKETPDRRIFLRADKTIDYGRVMAVLGSLNASGFKKIALITQQGTPAKR